MARGQRRQSVTFNDEAAAVVERLAAERRVSVSEIIREALVREAWFDRTTREGSRILVQRGTEAPREVEFIT